MFYDVFYQSNQFQIFLAFFWQWFFDKSIETILIWITQFFNTLRSRFRPTHFIPSSFNLNQKPLFLQKKNRQKFSSYLFFQLYEVFQSFYLSTNTMQCLRKVLFNLRFIVIKNSKHYTSSWSGTKIVSKYKSAHLSYFEKRQVFRFWLSQS